MSGTQHLTFSVHGEEYAVEILRVREVIGALPVTRVPATPASIRGVVNLRGAVVPVVDLGLRFGLSELPITKRTCIVLVDVIEDGVATGMGLLVDQVNRVIELEPGAIETVPPFGLRVRLDFLSGLGEAGLKFVMLLDVDKVLEANDLRAAASAPTAEGVAVADAASVPAVAARERAAL